MQIGPVNLDHNVLIIAEIGNNHEGDIGRANEMIAAAAECGANAVKFQTIVPEKLVSAMDTDRIRQLQRFQLRQDQFEQLAASAQDHGLIFLSTPFDLGSVSWLDELVPAFKIASSDNTFWPLVDRIAATGKPVLMSTGLASMSDVSASIDRLYAQWRKLSIGSQLVLLHCVSAYPTPPESAQLRAIQTLAKRFGETVGYSDHTLGIDACVLATALGARAIEKHFTLDHNLSDFHDHQLSADPAEMKQLVQRCRMAETLLGNEAAGVQPVESDNVSKWRRSIVAARKLYSGQVISVEDLDWVRPGTGLAPGREYEIVGHVLSRSIEAGECIHLHDVRISSDTHPTSSSTPHPAIYQG
jgi:N,N'-diacetyllegionaminate synthase